MAVPRSAARLPIVSAILIALFALTVFVRLDLSRSQLAGSEELGEPFFVSEAAVHYRYARMVARGEVIPDVDRALQAPEGVHPWRDLTVFMEPIVGLSYRWTGASGVLSFGDFVVLFVVVASSFSLVPAWFLGRRLWRSEPAGVAAAAIFSLSIPAADRVVASFLRETLALPLLFGAVALLAAALDRETVGSRARRRALGAGLLFGLALAAWHFSRFFLLGISVVLFALALVASPRRIGRVGRIAAWMLGPLLVASFAVPVLRAKALFTSPPFALLGGIACGALVLDRLARRGGGGSRIRRMVAIVVPSMVAVLAGTLAKGEAEGYGHVWHLMAAKVRFFGRKPVDPGVLPFDAKSLWVEAFHSPTPFDLVNAFGIPTLLLAVCVARRRWRVSRGDAAPRPDPLLVVFTSLCLAGFLVAHLMVHRLSALPTFFLAALAAGSVARLRQRERGIGVLAAVLVTLVLAHEQWRLTDRTPLRRVVESVVGPPRSMPAAAWLDDQIRTLRWIERETPPEAVFLASIGTSAQIAAYADRAVALQPKFEARRIREKYHAWVEAIVTGDEEALARLCDDWGVTHVLHEARSSLASGPESLRYLAGRTDLERSSVAYLLQFDPESLERFELVFQTASWRVFRRTDAPRPPERSALPPLFDLAAFSPQDPESPRFDDGRTEAVFDRLGRARARLAQARSLLRGGRPGEALATIGAALEDDPALPSARALAAWAMLQAEEGPPPEVRARRALAAAEAEVELHPDLAIGPFVLAMARSRLGDGDGALRALESAAALDPDFPGLEAALETARAG